MSIVRVKVGISMIILAVYCAWDPFEHSVVSEYRKEFETYKVELPAWSEVRTVRDGENRLVRGSERRFVGEVQGPESIAFDGVGRGPYTGVADGRVVFWNGHAWTDFAYTSSDRNFLQVIFSGDNSGRLLKYNSSTKETTVLMKNLQFPNGLSMSKDKSFFLFCEGTIGRLRRYWLKGEKAGTSEVFAILPGFPDNVRTNDKGEFWVAIHTRRSMYTYICGVFPRFRKFLLKLPISLRVHQIINRSYKQPAMVVKYSSEGELLEILEDSEGQVVRTVSEVEENDGKLWFGSVLMPFIAVHKLE
ncbi:hypothetical protein Syun_002388 [Stephania yunnanensis]|uniref:Strictosidine synthase conserved region domain-containing protein n=1 Tax=Stephania yunnanensis TaxID=152371 RepID=A0AAP0LFD0_9MAGN